MNPWDAIEPDILQHGYVPIDDQTIPTKELDWLGQQVDNLEPFITDQDPGDEHGN